MTWQLWRLWRFVADMWGIYRMPVENQLHTRHGYARLRWAWLWASYGWQLSAEAREMERNR